MLDVNTDHSESKISELRQRLQGMVDDGISQAFIATQAGVHPSTICRLLNDNITSKCDAAIRLWEWTTSVGPSTALETSEDVHDANEPPVKKDAAERRFRSSQSFAFTVVRPNVVEIPGPATLLVKWLSTATENALACIAVVTPDGLRRLLPLSASTREKLARLEESFEKTPATIEEYASERIRLDRYLANAWDVTIKEGDGSSFELSITKPENAIASETLVHVWVRSPGIIELSGLPEDKTDLMAELKRVGKEFPNLLDRYS